MFWFAAVGVLWIGAAVWVARIGNELGSEIVRVAFGPQVEAYLKAAPPALGLYLVVAAALRHAVALLLGGYVRRARGSSKWTRVRVVAKALGTWAALAFLGAFAVWCVEPSRAAAAWALDVGTASAVAGVPCVSAIGACALLASRGLVYWLLALALLLWLGMLTFGLGYGKLPPVLPGLIDQGLVMGRENAFAASVAGASGWALVVFGVAGVTDGRRSR